MKTGRPHVRTFGICGEDYRGAPPPAAAVAAEVGKLSVADHQHPVVATRGNPAAPLALLLLFSVLGYAPALAQNSPAPMNTAPTAPATSADPSATKAKHLLDEMIAALGGQSWLTYKTLSQQGRAYSFYHGKPTSEGTLFWRFYEYPDKERRELSKQRDVVYIYRGGKGFEKTYKGTAADEEKNVQEVVRRTRHSLEVIIRQWLKDPATMLFYDGQSVADRQLVDMVTLLNKENDQVSIGIDVHSHLPVLKRYTWRDPDKYKVEEETIYANYRLVQGIQTPYTLTNLRDGEMTGQSFLSHAEYNSTFAPGFFDATVTYNPETYRPAKK